MKDNIVVLKERFEFNGKVFERGHHFTIIDSSYNRGWDLKDDDGNCIYECLFIHDKFMSISDWRDEKINEII